MGGTGRTGEAANGTYLYDENLKRVKSVVSGKTIYNVYDASGKLVHVDKMTDNKFTDYIKGPKPPLTNTLDDFQPREF